MSNLELPAVNSAPLVSVCITSYNSERWLARALDSVLQQRTSFPLEVVIGDDHSADQTVAVARSFEQRYPLVRILARSKNLGMQRNYYETFEQCRGKYIAWLDADDYWTDPDKLELQINQMELDTSISASSHFVRFIRQDGTIAEERRPLLPSGRYGLADIILQNFVPSPSIVFRNGIHRNLPQWYFALPGLVDWPILVLAAEAGDIVLLDRVMADYALTPESAYMAKGPVYQDEVDLKFCDCMESFLPPKLQRYVRAARGKRYESMAYILRKRGDFAGSRRAAVRAFFSPDLTDNFGSKFKTLFAAALGPWFS